MADFQRDIHFIILQCGSRNQGRKQTDTLAASIVFFGSVILGNEYIAPATSLHLTFSIELRTSVCFLLVRILDECYFLQNVFSKKIK